jgi:hypothetical protein
MPKGISKSTDNPMWKGSLYELLKITDDLLSFPLTAMQQWTWTLLTSIIRLPPICRNIPIGSSTNSPMNLQKQSHLTKSVEAEPYFSWNPYFVVLCLHLWLQCSKAPRLHGYWKSPLGFLPIVCMNTWQVCSGNTWAPFSATLRTMQTLFACWALSRLETSLLHCQFYCSLMLTSVQIKALNFPSNKSNRTLRFCKFIPTASSSSFCGQVLRSVAWLRYNHPQWWLLTFSWKIWWNGVQHTYL